MASIRFGGGIVDARGSISGNTFSRNAGGSYQRARIAPLNPRTTRQTEIREALAFRSAFWRTLTDAQRQAWIDAAAGPAGTYTNRLGEQQQYSGQQLFMRVAMIQAAWLAGGGSGGGGGGSEEPPPTPPSFTPPAQVEFGAITGTVTAGAIDALSINVTAAEAGNQVIVHASPPVSAGRMRSSSSRYALLQSEEDLTPPASIDLLAAFTAAYGASAEVGQKIWLRINRINYAGGTMSPPLYLSHVLTAGA